MTLYQIGLTSLKRRGSGLLVGNGKYIYSVIQEWAKLPKGETFGALTDVATDSRDRVYVFQRKDPPILVFDRDGHYLGSWGNGAFNRGHGMSIVNDVVYLTDSDDSVVLIYTLEGRPLQVIGRRGVHSDTGTEKYGGLVLRAAGPFNHPTKLFPAPWGDLYVTDGERNCRVHRFSGDGKLLASWGEPGKVEPNQFHFPHSIWVDGDERLYVCDRENSRIHVMSADGAPIAMWTDVRQPTDIRADGAGVFYVSQFAWNVTPRYAGYPLPAGNGSALMGPNGQRMERPDAPPQVSVLDRNGRVLASWPTRSGHGLCLDSSGNIYVAMEDDRCVDKYVRQY